MEKRKMFNTNVVLMEFAEKNYIAVYLGIMILRWVGKKTPWAWDDDVGDAVSGLFGFLRPKNGKTTTNNQQQ